MKRVAAAVTLLVMVLTAASALCETAPVYTVTDRGAVYESDSLRYDIEIGRLNGTKVYLVRLWMQDPGRQIRKVTARWREGLARAENLAARIPEAAVAINGSGYVSPYYPEIPENYPGTSADYYYTSLGSLAITDDELLRRLDSVPYYGLTLEADGLHMYDGEDNETVLSGSPSQTWAFYERCPLIRDGVSLLDRTWPFALRNAARTVIARVDDHNYAILIVTSVHGLPLTDCTDFLLETFHPQWAFNLDGGPSTALIRRRQGRRTQKLIYGSKQKVFDVMCFVELTE